MRSSGKGRLTLKGVTAHRLRTSDLTREQWLSVIWQHINFQNNWGPFLEISQRVLDKITIRKSVLGLELRHALLTRVHTTARAAWLSSNPVLPLPVLRPRDVAPCTEFQLVKKVAEGCWLKWRDPVEGPPPCTQFTGRSQFTSSKRPSEQDPE